MFNTFQKKLAPKKIAFILSKNLFELVQSFVFERWINISIASAFYYDVYISIDQKLENKYKEKQSIFRADWVSIF